MFVGLHTPQKNKMKTKKITKGELVSKIFSDSNFSKIKGLIDNDK
jgi:hypothetical protein